MTVRVRIAPAPSGELHIGNARTALYNWLFARHNGGVFVLRIEDTDRERVKPEFIESAIGELRWLGLDWDEGPGAGGQKGPYLQSERLQTYAEAAAQLAESGKAYRCYCTPEELDARRKQAQAEKRRPGYDGRCYRLSAEERSAFEAEDRRWVLRLHVPDQGETTFHDLITGPVTWRHAEIDDFAIMRMDGYPIYNFGVALDDSLMEITHVIRGMDIQSSTPRQILVMEALGRRAPEYAHIPLVMGPGGKKLSKRYGGGSVQWYREHGFLPQALLNWLVLLGTGFGDDTIIDKQDMIRRFDLEKVNPSAAVFDLDKLEWMNGEYIRALSLEEFIQEMTPWLEKAGLTVPSDVGVLNNLAGLIQTRIKRLEEAPAYAKPVLGEIDVDEAAFEKVMQGPHVVDQLQRSVKLLQDLRPWEREGIEAALRQVQIEMELKPKTAFAPFYVAITGSTVGAPVFDVMNLIGKQACLSRLGKALDRLN